MSPSRIGRTQAKKSRILVVASICTGLVVVSFLVPLLDSIDTEIVSSSVQGSSESELIEYINPTSYRVEWDVKVDFANGVPRPDSLDLFISVPTNWTSQTVTSITTSPSTSILPETENGNTYLHYRESDMSLVDGKWEIQTEHVCEFISYEINTHLATITPVTFDTESQLYTLYTRHEPYVETDNFTTIAKDIVGDEADFLDQARLVYDWIIDNIEYEHNRPPGSGAWYAYQNRKGDCQHFHSLFIALVRSLGIPARHNTGFELSKPGNGHVWAEFYLQDIGWILVDATFGQYYSNLRDYYFGNVGADRVIMSKGLNLPLEDGFVAWVLQAYHVWWEPTYLFGDSICHFTPSRLGGPITIGWWILIIFTPASVVVAVVLIKRYENLTSHYESCPSCSYGAGLFRQSSDALLSAERCLLDP